MDKSGPTNLFFRNLALAGVSFACLLLVAGLALTYRGRAEMGLSDRAFHSGDLRGALVHAKSAALAYVPGSQHVRMSYTRLEAIAKGAEAEGKLELGRLAWETLRNVHAQTKYPGRPQSDWERAAEAGLGRIDAAYRAEDE
jgi:hypothetical protein